MTNYVTSAGGTQIAAGVARAATRGPNEQRPKMRSVAPTMIYDFEVMGDFSVGGTIPEDLVRGVGPALEG